VGGPKVAGCHVIGTGNTGFPDLGAPPEVATVIFAGNLEELQAASEVGLARASREKFEQNLIRSFAAKRTWENFRQGIRDFIEVSEGCEMCPAKSSVPS
jgi:tRNA A37 methylthiotransferase MiaB